MTITASERLDLIKVAVGLFNAAPGATYLSGFVPFAGNTDGLISALVADPAFTAIYPTYLTSAEFADKFVNTIVGSATVDATVEQNAKDWIAGRLDAGESRASVLADVLAQLDGVANDDATWGQVATQFHNKVAVAEYYSVTQAGTSTSLTTLQNVVKGVDAATDVSTPEALAAAITSGGVDANVGQTYTLTKDQDIIAGTAGNDTINGLIDLAQNSGGTATVATTSTTFNGFDQINGAAGTNTFKLAVSGDQTKGDYDVSLANIEKLQIVEINNTSTGGKKITVNASTNADVTDLKVIKSASEIKLTASDAQNITTAGTADAITLEGGKNITVNDVTANVAMNIGQTTAAKGTITVTDTKQGTGAIKVDGGTDVTVTLGGVSTGTLDIGQLAGTTADPTGAVVVNSTGAAYVAGSAVTLGAIKVDGGKTISVTQVATSDNSRAAADKAPAAITQSAVTIKAGTTTTDVTVKQDAAVAAKAAVDSTGGATTTNSVKFKDLAATKTVSLGGLTLTATVNMTAAEVAAAFASLDAKAPKPGAATGDTQSSAAAAKGVFSGSINGWTSGAASGDTVVFTNTTANSVQAAITDGGNGAATAITSVATGKAHDATPTGGVMGIINGVVDITGAAALKTVSVDGYAAGVSANKVQGAGNTALDTITLANGGDMTISSAAATLALSATKVNGTVNVAAGTKTLNATVNGSNTDTTTLKSASATAVNVVAGSGNVAGTTATGLTAATAINTTGFTGTATFTIDSTVTTYTGGAGKDIVTFSNTTAAAKPIDLGDGDDTLVLAAGGATTPTVTIKGGAGVDTLSLTTALAANGALSASTAFGAKLDSFERLLINDVGAAATVDLANLGFTSYVTAVGSTGILTLDKLANDGTVVLTGDAIGLTVNVKDAGTNLTDVLNVGLSKNGVLAAGTLTATGVETVKVTATDTDTTDGISVHTLTLKDADATSLVVGGNAGLTLTLDATTTKLATINASAMTGALTATANGSVAMTITGGSGADVLTASLGATAKADVINGGDGNDTITAGSNGAVLTGGAGNDLFVLTATSATTGNKEANTYSTITDFSAGDVLQLTFFNKSGAAVGVVADNSTGKVAGFAKLAAVLNEDTANFSNFVDAAIKEANIGEAVWFNFKGSAYVVVDSNVNSVGDNFINGEDLVIKLAGVSGDNLSYNSDFGTVALV